ncbi:hypothetical protein MWH28_12215 [Natroniella sulfidigena]|uniref:hypothetical protein n=1 Tax=Natroniella sulfidigena TaxID=723921 RepID=UPI00200B6D57|nr:hypothetical protein [Natroniella sulfidigena]MCK8818121.1 hypothetical protein [Natroniella sulfidigena]
MGGLGSGRYSRKTAVEDCLGIDVNYLNRKGFLEEGCQFTLRWSISRSNWSASISAKAYKDYIVLDYIVEKERELNYSIQLDKVPMNLGGYKNYLRCPKCNSRVEKIYKSSASDYFLCRDCLDLVYRSSKESGDELAKVRRKLDKLYSKLNGKWRGVYSIIPDKPKNMHQRTYLGIRKDIIKQERLLDGLFCMKAEDLIG